MNQGKKKPFKWKGEKPFKVLRKNCFVRRAYAGVAAGTGTGWDDVGLHGMLPRDPDLTCASVRCFGTGNFHISGQNMLIVLIIRAALPVLPTVTEWLRLL